MTGTDLLNGGTDTPAISQRSEAGRGILVAKEGRGMWVWSSVVAVLSCMSVGVCSSTGRHDKVSYLTITAIQYRKVFVSTEVRTRDLTLTKCDTFTLEPYPNGTPDPTVVTKEVDMTVTSPFLLVKPNFSKTEVVKTYVHTIVAPCIDYWKQTIEVKEGTQVERMKKVIRG